MFSLFDGLRAGGSLRQEANRFGVRTQKLTLPYLVQGYYPLHSLLVATAMLLVSLAMWVGEGAGQAPLLFTTLTSFVATSVMATMVCTALYRVLLAGNRSSSLGTCYAAQQADWLLDVAVKGTVDWLATLMLEGPTAARVGLVLSLSAVGMLGNCLGSSAAVVAVLSVAWGAYITYVQWRSRCREADDDPLLRSSE